MKKLNIVMVSGHACIRMEKQALTLLQKGHNVHSISHKIPPFYESFDSISIYGHARQIISAVERFEKSNSVDIYHVHNEPSWYVSLIKEITNRPVVLDVHDTFLSRSTEEEHRKARDAGEKHVRTTSEEMTNFQMADGLVFCSDQVRDIACREFELTQSNTVLHSYVPENFYKYNLSDNWLGGLVYQGKVMTATEMKSHRSTGFEYCDYLQTAEDCYKQKMPFHIYAGGAGNKHDELKGMYKDTAFIHRGVPYRELLLRLSEHSWGLVGNVVDTPQWNLTTPNKLYEYLAACIPVCVINAQPSAEVVDNYNVGIVVNSVDELAERWEECREKRTNVIKRRKELTMDNHIYKIEDLYKELL